MLDVPHNRAAITTLKESSVYTLDQDNAAHLMRILRGLYSDEALSVSRELICNALDACHSIGKKGNTTEVSFGTSDVPCLDVRDYGPGLSIEEANKYLFSFGGSESRFSETAIGNKGLGAKSPFCLSDQFTVISRHKGTKHTWLCFLDVDDCCQHTDPVSVPCDEPDGLQTTVPLKDTCAVQESLKSLLQYFPLDERPILKGLPANWVPMPSEVFMEGTATVQTGGDKEKKVTWSLVESVHSPYQSIAAEATLLLGPIAYRIDPEQADATRLGLLLSHVRISAPVNLVPLVPSREAIAYTGRSKRILAELLKSIVEEIRTRLSTSSKISKLIRNMEPLKALFFIRSMCADNYYNPATYIGTERRQTLISEDIMPRVKALSESGDVLLADIPKHKIWLSKYVHATNYYRNAARNVARSHRKICSLPPGATIWTPKEICIIEGTEGKEYDMTVASRKASHTFLATAEEGDHLVIILDPKVPLATFEASLGWKPRWTTITAAEYDAAPEVPELLYEIPEPPQQQRALQGGSPCTRNRVKYNSTGGKLLLISTGQANASGWYADNDAAPSKHFSTLPMRSVAPGSTIAAQQLKKACRVLSLASETRPYEGIYITCAPGLALLFKGIDVDAKLMAYKKSEDLEVLKTVYTVVNYSQLLDTLLAKHKVTSEELELARSIHRLLAGRSSDEALGVHRVSRVNNWANTASDKGLAIQPCVLPLLTEARRRYPDHPGTVLLNLWDTLSPERKRLILSAELARIVLRGTPEEEVQLQESTGALSMLMTKLILNSPTACMYARELYTSSVGGCTWGYLYPEVEHRNQIEGQIRAMADGILQCGIQTAAVKDGEAEAETARKKATKSN